MAKIKLKYNDETQWCDFSNGVHLSNNQVQQMVDDVVENLLNSQESGELAYMATGDTIVIGWCHDNNDDDGSAEITIIVTQNYKEATIVKNGWEVISYDE